jgi:hypothetical protein
MAVGAEAPSFRAVARGELAVVPIWHRPYRPHWVRALNAVGGLLRRAGARWPRLDPAEIMAAATRRAGLSDWGGDEFREPLEVLVAAFEARDVAHTFGRLFFREFCVRALVNRLKIQADFARHPEILEVPIRKPLIISGFPRSGSTLLHRLMSEAPFGRSLLFWEQMEPSPPPGAQWRRPDPRIARAYRTLRHLEALAPSTPAAHRYEAEGPEECHGLFVHGLRSSMIPFIFDVPAYFEWLGTQEWIAPYQYMRRQLQLLAWRRPEAHWVLKSPAHLFVLEVLPAVYPDACIVQMHRDPRAVVPSLCSLASGFRGITSERIDWRRLGAEIAETMAIGIERAMAARAAADPARFLDVTYPQLVADPIGTVRGICDYFGYPCTAELEARARRRLAGDPRHKHGVHRYGLEQFGLGPVAVDERFAAYRDWAEAHLRRPI